jgi:hypothetical protein
MKESNMENLTDEELLELVNKYLDKVDNHLYSSIILSVVTIIQSLLLIFEYSGLIQFLVIYIISIFLYFYHKKKTDKYMSIVDELIKQLTSVSDNNNNNNIK